MHRLAVLIALASCSSGDHEPPPRRRRPAGDPTATLTQQEKHALVGEVIAHAKREVEAGAAGTASPCGLPATLERAEITGTLRVSDMGGKRTHTAAGDLEGGQLALLAGAELARGRTTLRPRRGRDDFSRPIVVQLGHSGRALDAVAGRLVIDQTTPALAGHLEAAEFRERREDFTYVDGGCTMRAGRIEFRFVRTPPR